VNHQCECTNEYTGPTCTEFIKQLEYNKEVSATVEADSWKYYRIHEIRENTLRVVVNETSTSGDVDMYIGFSHPPTLTKYDLAEQSLSKNFYLDIELNASTAGHWYIGMYGVKQSSFKIHYETYNQCPNQCSMHGTCSTNGCTCRSGYTGTYCEAATGNLQDGQVVKGFVADTIWNYYTYQPESVTEFVISLNETGPAKNQDCDLYVRKDARPTLTSFDARNISSEPKTTLRIPDAQFAKWHIGVFGFTPCTYFISASSSSRCGQCVHGSCATNAGECICNNGWTGQYCDKQITQITNFSQPIMGHLATGNWDYYSVQGISGRFLTVHLLEQDSIGAFWTFLNPKFPPTLMEYNRTLSDKESNTDHHSISTEVNNDDVWYIGVYGSPFAPDSSALPYELQVWESPF